MIMNLNKMNIYLKIELLKNKNKYFSLNSLYLLNYFLNKRKIQNLKVMLPNKNYL